MLSHDDRVGRCLPPKLAALLLQVFDPAGKQVASALQKQSQWQSQVKRSAEALKQRPEYQILYVAGTLDSPREIEASKVIDDKKISI